MRESRRCLYGWCPNQPLVRALTGNGIFFLLQFFLVAIVNAQAQNITVSGYVIDSRSKQGLLAVKVQLEAHLDQAITDRAGFFEISIDCNSQCVLEFQKEGYARLRLPVFSEKKDVELGLVILSRENPVEGKDVLLALSETELNDEEGVSDAVGFLQGTRDIFLNRAAFDFSQSFFRVRGYDSAEGLVHFNGLPMNQLFDGRPQWNNWGGLNDVMRNQTHSLNLSPSEVSFGGLQGTVNFLTNPADLRPGYRLSTSASNRSYTGRFMGTYASGKKDNGFSYSFSLSRRWASQGYIAGTLYDAYSLFGAITVDLGAGSQLLGHALFARNRRGRSAPITEEVFELAGRTYNPNWGLLGGQILNTRERIIEEPIFGIHYQLQKKAWNLTIGLAYKFGFQSSGRLGYYQAPNPDPTYYRYLPSYYLNSGFGNNFNNAYKVADEFISNGQIPFNSLYLANSNDPEGKASYLHYADVTDGNTLTTGLNSNLKIGPLFQLDFGLHFRKTKTKYFSQLDDLLGASYHLDIEPFSETRNDVQGALQKRLGDAFGYNYRLELQALDSFIQLQFNNRNWEAHTTLGWGYQSSQRIGEFQNARYPDNSFGPGPVVVHTGVGLKGGIGYKPNARIAFNINGLLQKRPPFPKKLFINPRDNQNYIPYNSLPTVTALEGNVLIRFPNIIGRISAFSTWFQNESEIGFYYTDSGLGSDFVQEVLTNISRVHRGLEFGLEYKASSTVAFTLAGAYSSYRYANNPETALYFDVSENDQNPIDASGTIDLGKAALKGIYLSRGPQRAISFGINYRDPDFWFVSATLNRLGRNYIDTSVLPRTESFFLNPLTGESVSDIDTDLVSGMLKQTPLPSVQLLNIIGGKSWLIKGIYLGIFISMNNVLDATFRTGGFEQSRNGNYSQFIKDNLSTTPSFAPKYWYGYGRTYFVNLSLSF